MSDIDLFTITSKLESTKIKDRNEGLELLEQVTKTNQTPKAKVMNAILEALFGLMSSDKASYLKNPTAATRSRLEMASYTMRKLMSMQPKKLKYRSVKDCFLYMTNGFFSFDGTIFEPFAMNFSKTFYELIAIDKHRDHLTIEDWLRLTQTILKALRRQIDINTNEKFFTDLMLSLRSLLQVRTIVLMDIREDLTDLLVRYFRNIQKETSVTSIALEIVNQTLVLFSTAAIYDGILIVRYVVKATGTIANTNMESLKEQLMVFGMLASKYMYSNMAVLISDDPELEISQDVELRDDLIHWIDRSLVGLTKSSQPNLSLNMIQYYNTDNHDTNWFHFSTIGMASPTHSRPWMSLISVVSLLNALCPMNAGKSSSTTQPWKKRKLDSQSFASALSESSSVTQFTLKLLESTSVSIQTLGLQILVFHITNFKTDTSSLSINDVMKYEKQELSPWVSLSIRAMIQYGWSPTIDQCNNILRINLQMIKEPLTTDISCQLILQILSIPSFIITDRPINQLIRSLFEVPHVYGPAHISNDSLKFWMVISDHSKFLNNGEFRTGGKIITWLITRINKPTFQGPQCDLLPHLILWLTEKKYQYIDTCFIHDDVFSRFNSKWMHLGTLPSRMMNTKVVKAQPQNMGKFHSSKPPTKGFDDLDKLVNCIISIMSESNNPDDVIGLSRLIAYGITIYQGIYNITQLNSAAERLKHDVIRMLESLSLTSGTKDAVLDELNKIRIFNNGGLFVLEYLNPSNLLSDTDDSTESIDTSMTNEFDDFGSVRRYQDRSIVPTYYSLDELRCVTTSEQKVSSLIVRLNMDFDDSCTTSVNTEKVLDYLSTVATEKRALPFYSFLRQMEPLNPKQRACPLSKLVDVLKPCLNSEASQRSPLVRCALIKLFHLYSDEFFSSGSVMDKQFFCYGVEFVLTIFNNDGIYDEESHVLLGELLLSLIVKGHALNISESPDYDKKFLKIWNEKSNVVRSSLANSASSYLSQLAGIYQQKFFDLLVKASGPPEPSSESASTFCICMEYFAMVCHPLLISSLTVLLKYHGSLHFSKYLQSSIQSIFVNIGESIVPTEMLRLELLSSWYCDYNQFTNFPFALFGYSDFDSFIVENKYQLYAISKANKRSNPSVVDLVVQKSGAEEEIDIALGSLSLTIPLSFTQTGVKSKTATSLAEMVDESLIEYQSFLIVQRFIEFADVSKETDFLKCIPGLKEDGNTNRLVSSSPKELYPRSNISVGLTTAVHEIKQYDNGRLWTPQVIHFISKRLLSRLSEANSTDEKIIALRRLKLLFILGFKALNSDLTAFPIVISLKDYLLDEQLHDDTAILIEFVLRSTPHVTSSCLYPSAIVQLLGAVTHVYESEKAVHVGLKQTLLEIYTNIDAGDHWRVTLSPFADVLRAGPGDCKLGISLQALHEALTYVAKNPGDGMIANIFSVMALVFSKEPEKSIPSEAFRCDRTVAQLLLDSHHISTSIEVKAFIARYLGRFYLETGDDLRSERKDSLNEAKSDMFQYYGTLRAICDIFVELGRAVDDQQESMMIESILGSLLYEYQQSPDSYDGMLDVESHLTATSGTLIPIDSFIFSVLHPVEIRCDDLRTVLCATDAFGLDPIDWSQKVSLAILQILTRRSQWFEKIMCYLVLYKERSLKLMNLLWMIYAYEFEAVGAKDLLKFLKDLLSKCLDNPNSTRLDLLIQLCSLVRSSAKGDVHDGSPDDLENNQNDRSTKQGSTTAGIEGSSKESFKGSYGGGSRGSSRVSARRSNSKGTPEPKVKRKNYFRFLYNRLDLLKMCLCAHHGGYHKFSLGIFEEVMMPKLPSNDLRTLEENSNLLSKLYEGIDDMDLIYGVPVDPSLDYAIDLLNKANRGSMKQIMFNSARFDCGIGMGGPEGTRGDLFSSLALNSFNGLASLVNDYADPSHKLENGYDWSWRLSQWDMASPEKPQTESEMIYSALKALSENVPISKVQGLFTDVMVSALELEGNDRLKTLSTLFSVDEIIRSSIFGMNLNIQRYIDDTEAWFKVSPFSDFEDIILSRRIAFEALSVQKNEPEAILACSLEFARYGQFSRLHGDQQKAINNTVLLDKLVKQNKNDELTVALRKVSNFESACTLWSQGETFIPIAILMKELDSTAEIETKYFSMDTLNLSSAFIQSYLVKWNSESRQKKFENIMIDYVQPALNEIESIQSHRERAETLHNIAYFCYKQIRHPAYDEELHRKRIHLEVKQKELLELKMIVTNKKAHESERRDAKRFYNKLAVLLATEKDAYAVLLENKNKCIRTALRCLLHTLSISDDYDMEDVDKFCALWLQFSHEDFVNELVRDILKQVPSHKFIPWLNQLCSRLSNDSGSFQSVLQGLIENISFRHPFHSIYFLVNLRVHRKYDLSRTDKSIASRVEAADAVVSKLMKKNVEFGRRVVAPIEEMCNHAIRLATERTKGVTVLRLDSLNVGSFWLRTLPSLQLPLPTMNNVTVSLTSDYKDLPRIVKVDSDIVISQSGISLPKIMKILLSDGSTQKLLLKGSTDDLRQDAIMEQVFEKVNLILRNNEESRKRNLRIRTYKVVPLGPQAGMIEFVANSTALADILKPYHSNDPLGFDQARLMMKEVQQKTQSERINAYMKIAQQTQPCFRFFFFDTFLNINEWYKSRQSYTRGIVTTSIVGYTLGLGDRHLNNILLDRMTGEPIHIDLGVAFDQGKLLPVPELVPFRLTRDIVDGLGVTGVEGAFRKGSELVFKVLRDNSEKIVGILDVLKYDPLYTWAISPVRRKRLQEIDTDETTSMKIEDDGSEAVTALKGVEEKLAAHGLSVEATVQELIQEATDVKNLAVIYLGWAPFY